MKTESSAKLATSFNSSDYPPQGRPSGKQGSYRHYGFPHTPPSNPAPLFFFLADSPTETLKLLEKTYLWKTPD